MAADAHVKHLEAAADALRHLIVTLEGAPSVSPYTAGAIESGREALAIVDED